MNDSVINDEMAATLEVIARLSPLEILLYACRPTIRVDGKMHRAPWGRPLRVTVAPGLHSVEAFFSHLLLRKAGRKQIYLKVAKGQIRHLEYRPPHLSFMEGSFRETTPRRRVRQWGQR